MKISKVSFKASILEQMQKSVTLAQPQQSGKPCLRRSRLNSIRFHDLRHTYASLMLSEGATINYAQKQVTLRYIGIEQDQIDESYTNFVL